MKPLALAVWPAGAVASFVGLVSGDRTIHEGEIAFERAPYCDTFVVRTKDSFVLMEDDDGWLVALAGATHVHGFRYVKGPQNVGLNGRARLNVTVTGWVATREHAEDAFERQCDTAAPTRALRH